MTRTNAREIAAHLLYAMEYTGQSAQEIIDARLEPDYYAGLSQECETYLERPNKKQRAYIYSIVSGVTQKQEELNALIARFSIGWNISRISKLAKTFMQIAMFECLYLDEVPAGVAINEAVNLTKMYDEDAAKFVNGILGSFSRAPKEPECPSEPEPSVQDEDAELAAQPELKPEAPTSVSEESESAQTVPAQTPTPEVLT